MSAAQKIILDREKILNQIEGLFDIANEQGWKHSYDPDTDEFVFGKDYMPRDSFLFNVNDELNLFLSPDSTVNGIFIEYFASNFIEHNKELESVLSILEEEAEEVKPKENKKEVARAKKALEYELLTDTFKSLLAKEQLITAI